MANFTYTGDAEMTFPTLGITVNKGDKFEAPDDFAACCVISTKTPKATPAPTLGE